MIEQSSSSVLKITSHEREDSVAHPDGSGATKLKLIACEADTSQPNAISHNSHISSTSLMQRGQEQCEAELRKSDRSSRATKTQKLVTMGDDKSQHEVMVPSKFYQSDQDIEKPRYKKILIKGSQASRNKKRKCLKQYAFQFYQKLKSSGVNMDSQIVQNLDTYSHFTPAFYKEWQEQNQNSVSQNYPTEKYVYTGLKPRRQLSIGPPVLSETRIVHPPNKRELQRVREHFMHPIFFPKELSSLPFIYQYYKGLNRLASDLSIAKLNHEEINPPKKQNIRLIEVKQTQWLSEFVKEFTEKRVPNLTCPHLLEYWNWIFKVFEMDAILEIQSYPDAPVERYNFNWETCQEMLHDPSFFAEIDLWCLAAKKRNEEIEFGIFCQQINRRPYVRKYRVAKPKEFFKFCHFCRKSCQMKWTESEFKEQFPALAHCYSSFKMKRRLDHTKTNLTSDSNKQLHAQIDQVEAILEVKYGKFFDPEIMQQLKERCKFQSVTEKTKYKVLELPQNQPKEQLKERLIRLRREDSSSKKEESVVEPVDILEWQKQMTKELNIKEGEESKNLMNQPMIEELLRFRSSIKKLAQQTIMEE